MADRFARAGTAGLIVVNPEDELFPLAGAGSERSAIPVLMIASRDAARLRARGGGRIRDQGARFVSCAYYGRVGFAEPKAPQTTALPNNAASEVDRAEYGKLSSDRTNRVNPAF